MLIFFLTFALTIGLYAVPVFLAAYEMPSYTARMGWLVSWIIVAIVIFFVGMLRRPDTEGHGHTPLAFMGGVIAGLAITIAVYNIFGRSF